jgi:hypothetical protein
VRSIWKFPFAIADEVSVEMPAGAKVLCVQIQHGAPCFWAVVNTMASMQTRRFRVFGTGLPFEGAGLDGYVGTIQQAEGSLVWHVFEIEP